jgi:hypothetical protein
MVGGGVEHDLRRGVGGEVGELKLLDGAVAVDGEAERVAGAGGLAEGRAEHARAAELGDEALGDLEGAAVGPDVLAEHDGLEPLGEDLAQAEVERLRHRDVFHLFVLVVDGTDRRDPVLRRRRGGEDLRGQVGGRDRRQGHRGLDGRLHEVVHRGIDGVELRGMAGGGEAGAELGQRIDRKSVV